VASRKSGRETNPCWRISSRRRERLVAELIELGAGCVLGGEEFGKFIRWLMEFFHFRGGNLSVMSGKKPSD